MSSSPQNDDHWLYTLTYAALIMATAIGGILASKRAGNEASHAGYTIPIRTEAEVNAQLTFACKTSVKTTRPVLVEFGADWCADCVELSGLEQEDELSAALGRFQRVPINIGEDLHPELREQFKVNAIARWIAFAPEDCSLPIAQWQPLGSRVVEPKTKGATNNADELAAWLLNLAESADEDEDAQSAETES